MRRKLPAQSIAELGLFDVGDEALFALRPCRDLIDQGFGDAFGGTSSQLRLVPGRAASKRGKNNVGQALLLEGSHSLLNRNGGS